MESLKVLIPTDFSVQAEHAYLMVKKLEEKIPVEIHFIHVLNVPDTVTMDKQGDIQTCGDISVEFVVSQKIIADRKLNNLKTLYGNDVITHLELGKLTEKIVAHPQENKPDVIATGTQGARGSKEKLSGSETQIVARQSMIPSSSSMRDRSDLIIQNILLAHDFTNPKNENSAPLHKLIKAFNTKVHPLQISKDTPDPMKPAIKSNMDEFALVNNITNLEMHVLNDAMLKMASFILTKCKRWI